MTKIKSEITPSIVVPQKKEEVAVESFITQAIQAGLPVETMERLFALRKDVRAETAREAFTEALAKFQSEIKTISKTKKVMNKDGQTVRYQYAPLDSIIEQIKKPLTDNGFSYTFDVKNTPGFMTAIATVTHRFGHKETSEFMIPIDTEGYMTAPQKYASALTFAKRYALTNALGISTGDEDTDATDIKKEPDAKSPKARIVFLLRALKIDTKSKESIEVAVKQMANLDLEEKNYSEIVSRLEEIVKERQEYEASNV